MLLLQVFLQMFWLINLFFYGSWIVSHSWKDLATLRLQRYSSMFFSNIQKIEFWHTILDPVIVCINVFLIYFFLYLWYSEVFSLSYLSRVLTAPISQSSLLCHLFSVFLYFCIFCSYSFFKTENTLLNVFLVHVGILNHNFINYVTWLLPFSAFLLYCCLKVEFAICVVSHCSQWIFSQWIFMNYYWYSSGQQP